MRGFQRTTCSLSTARFLLSSYGYITSTPKPGWQDFDVLSHFSHTGVPTGFNTDVNTAAYGELVYGEHGADVRSVVYVTVGTGIGAGIVADGHMITGILHPEAGHIMVRRHVDDTFKGVCPFHGDCLEGLATANAIAARLGIGIKELKALSDEHPVWEMEAYYLAQLCINMAMIVSPHVIVLGGGVLKRRSLFPRIRKHFVAGVNGYLRVPKMLTDAYIVPSRFEGPESKTSAGCVGTLAYAKYIYEQEEQKRKETTTSTQAQPITPRSAAAARAASKL